MNSVDTVLILITTISALISMAYGVLVFVSGFRDDTKRYYFLAFSLSIALWVSIGQLLPVLVNNLDFVKPITFVAQTTVNVAALAFAMFITEFIYKTTFVKVVRTSLIIGFLFFELILALYSPVKSVGIDGATGLLTYNYKIGLLLLYSVLPLLSVAVPVILVAIDKTGTNKSKQTLELNSRFKSRLSLYSFLYSVSILLVTVVIPYYFIDELILEFALFNFVTLTFLVLLGKEVIGKKIVDFKKNSWQSVLRFVFKISFALIFVATSNWIPFESFNLNYLEMFAVEAYAILSAVIGWRLGDTVSKKLYQKYTVSLASLNERLQILREELDSDKLRQLFAFIICDELQVDRILIASKSLKGDISINELKKVNKKITDTEIKPENSMFSKLSSVLDDSFSREVPLNRIERSDFVNSDLANFYVGITYKNSEEHGFIAIGEKTDGEELEEDDLAILNAAVNEYVLLGQNARQFTRIKLFNQELEHKVMVATQDLQRTNAKLVALDEAKDEFVSMASHQLRTPLTSIKGYVSMVAEEDVGKLNEDQKKMLGQALFSSQRMVYLISDLLNVSRLKTGKFVIEAKPVYLPDVIESELAQLREGASSKDITLEFESPKQFPVMNLDEMKIRQVIMNFTDNAIYYTPNGGNIWLELKNNKESIEFRVKDTGIGVPKEERHRLFTKFYRAANARKARPDGTGLGLFMAKKVVIAQGGSIIFESVEGKGSTFGFSFPKKGIEVSDAVAAVRSRHESERVDLKASSE